MQGSGNWTMNTKFKLPGPRPGLDCLIQVFEDEYLQEITYLYKMNTIYLSDYFVTARKNSRPMR